MHILLICWSPFSLLSSMFHGARFSVEEGWWGERGSGFRAIIDLGSSHSIAPYLALWPLLSHFTSLSLLPHPWKEEINVSSLSMCEEWTRECMQSSQAVPACGRCSVRAGSLYSPSLYLPPHYRVPCYQDLKYPRLLGMVQTSCLFIYPAAAELLPHARHWHVESSRFTWTFLET